MWYTRITICTFRVHRVITMIFFFDLTFRTCHLPILMWYDGIAMFKNRNEERNNICGSQIRELRKERNWSQRELADQLKEFGIDINKNAIQRIEAGQRFVTDIEILALSKVLDCEIADLLENRWNSFIMKRLMISSHRKRWKWLLTLWSSAKFNNLYSLYKI